MKEGIKINCFSFKIILCLLIIGGFFVWPFFCFGAANEVVINEIAWMGTIESTNDEWIELKNNTDQEIGLTDWTLKAVDGSPEISLTGVIPAQGYFLLERTDDNSVSELAADQIYTGALGNTGESLELGDGENNLIDSIDCSEGWLAGDNETKQTMERIDTDWQTSLGIGGTPKTRNSSGQGVPAEEPPLGGSSQKPEAERQIPPTTVNQPPVAQAGPDLTALTNREIFFDASQSCDPNNDSLSYFWNFGDGATATEAKTSHAYSYPGQYIVSLIVNDGEFSDFNIITVNIYSSSVIISEFLPNPVGSDEESEWIELFNQSNQIANLTDWQLDDQFEGSHPFIFPANSLISPRQFLLILRPVSKIALDNDCDQVRFFYPNGSLASEISYQGQTEEGSAIAFDGRDYFWTRQPTPGAANIISAISLIDKSENLSANNPQSIIQGSQEPPEILVQTDAGRNQSTSALDQPSQTEASQSNQSIKTTTHSTEKSKLVSKQAADLGQSSRTAGQASLISTLSIIISASLLASWLLIRLNILKTH